MAGHDDDITDDLPHRREIPATTVTRAAFRDRATVSARDFTGAMATGVGALDERATDLLIGGLIAVVAEHPELYDDALKALRRAQENMRERAHGPCGHASE